MAMSSVNHKAAVAALAEAADEAVWGKRRRLYALILLCSVAGINFADRYALTVLVEPIKKDLRISDVDIGLLSGTSFAIVYLVFGMVLAVFSDRSVRRSILAGCLAFWSLMTICCGLAQNYSQLLSARMGVALGEAGGFPTTNSLIADLYPRSQRGTVMGVLLACTSVGLGLGVMCGGMLEQSWGWRGTLIIIGAPGLIVALLLQLTVAEPRRGCLDDRAVESEPVPLRRVVATLWSIPSLRFVLVIASISSIANNGLVAWLPTFLLRVHGVSAHDIGLWFGTGSVCGLVVGNLVAGRLTDVLQCRDIRWYGWLSAATLALTVPIGGLALLWPGSGGAFLWIAALLGVMCMWMPAIYSATLTLSPATVRSTMMTTLTAGSTFLGLGAGPLVVGMLNEALSARYGALSVRYSLLIMLGMFLLVVPLCLILAGRLRCDMLGNDARKVLTSE